MRFLRKLQGKIRIDKIRNDICRHKLKHKLKTDGITHIMQEGQLGWLGHVQRMGEERWQIKNTKTNY